MQSRLALNLVILLPQPPECYNSKYVLLCYLLNNLCLFCFCLKDYHKPIATNAQSILFGAIIQ